MKIILAIFAIALLAAFALRGRDDSPLDAQSVAVPALGGTTPLPAAIEARAAAERPPAEISDPGGGKGSDLLRMAGDRLDRHNSVSALIRYRANLFASEVMGTGLYQQAGQGRERRYRLELKTQLGDKLSAQIQVCDGSTLWTYRDAPTGAQLERLDLRRVRAAQSEAVSLPPSSPVEDLAIGGMPKLLAELQASFQTIQIEAGYLNNVPMWSIELEWNRSVLAALAEEQRDVIVAGSADFSKLPQMPERVMVYLGHEDLFPRRIEFRRRTSDSSEQKGAERGRAGQGGAGDFAPALTVEFTEVRLGEPIDPRQFEYGAAGAADVTDDFLQRRGLPMVR
jgi:hypothetical protein